MMDITLLCMYCAGFSSFITWALVDGSYKDDIDGFPFVVLCALFWPLFAVVLAYLYFAKKGGR